MIGRSVIRLQQRFRVVFIALFLCALAVPVQAQTHVLIIFDEDKDLPGLAVISRNLQEALHAQVPGPIEFYTESLRFSKFNSAGYDALVSEFLRGKYQGRQLDLIVAVMEPSLDFLLRHAGTLFPGVPIVFCGADPIDVGGMTLPGNVTGVVMKRTFAPTLDLALQLQPNTQNVFVIGGRSRFDRHLQAIARRELQGFEKRVSITWLTELPMQQLLNQVSALPSDSVVYYLTLFVDGADEAFIPHEALARIAQVANVPVYVAVDQYVGLGAIGGHVYSVADLGRQTAAIGSRVLRGEVPSSIPVGSGDTYKNLFDWRQLDRWGVGEEQLPADSEVEYRPISIWYLYKGYILAGTVLFLLQTALVIGLLISRAQRRRAELLRERSEELRLQAEDEVRRTGDDLAHALRVSTLGEMTASFAHELGQPIAAIIMNTEAAQLMRARDTADPDVAGALRDVLADANRATETLQRLRALFRKEPLLRERWDVNAAIAEVLRLLESQMRRQRVRAEFTCEAQLAYVWGDAVQLQQVLINLLVNATDAISGGDDAARVIHIESRRTAAERVEILICDSGVGVKESDLERIFERFVSSKPEGLGMGLAISRLIVEVHGGRIWATQNVGKGLTLHVELPIVKADAELAQPLGPRRAAAH